MIRLQMGVNSRDDKGALIIMDKEASDSDTVVPYASKQTISNSLLMREGGTRPQRESPTKRPSTQLLLARNAIVITVHFHSGAVPQKQLRLAARTHLRAVFAAVALKGW